MDINISNTNTKRYVSMEEQKSGLSRREAYLQYGMPWIAIS